MKISAIRHWRPCGYSRRNLVVVLTILGLQLALLWLQGSLLNRQHKEIGYLRSEVRNLSMALNDFLEVDELDLMTPTTDIKPLLGSSSHKHVVTCAQDGFNKRQNLKKTRKKLGKSNSHSKNATNNNGN